MTRPRRACRASQPAGEEDDVLSANEEDSEDYKPRAGETRKRTRRTAQDEDSDSEHEAPTPVVRKKVKKAGKLSKLQEMPMDILMEVFASLHPFDLLRVSRIAKAFHRVLSVRSARTTWVQALATIPDMPPCPEDLTEIAWTRLAFESTCHMCGAKGVKHVLWALRMRACTKCAKTNSILFRGNLWYRHDDLEDSKKGKLRIPWEVGNEHRFCTLFLQKDMSEFEEVVEREDAGEDMQEWIDERTKKTRAMREHALLCHEWYISQKEQHNEDLDAIRQQRKEAIYVHLRELGYDKEVEWMEKNRPDKTEPTRAFDQLKSVRQPKALTARMWTNMQSEALGVMADIRIKYQIDAQIRVLRRRVELLVSAVQQRSTSYAPRVIDMYSLESIRQVLDRPLENGQDTVDANSFANALSDFEAVVAHCEAHRRDHLVDAVHDSHTCNRQDEVNLNLAVNLFGCYNPETQLCAYPSPLGYGDALAHRCFPRDYAWEPRNNYSSRPCGDDWTVVDHLQQLELVGRWVAGAGDMWTVAVSTPLRSIAMRILALLSLKPETTTPEDLDAVGAWFRCPWGCYKCKVIKTATGQEAVFQWREMIKHWPSDPPQRLSPEAEERARAAAALVVPDLDNEKRAPIWDCQLCSKLRMTAEELRAHGAEIHNVPTVIHGEHYRACGGFCSPVPTVTIESLA